MGKQGGLSERKPGQPSVPHPDQLLEPVQKVFEGEESTANELAGALAVLQQQLLGRFTDRDRESRLHEGSARNTGDGEPLRREHRLLLDQLEVILAAVESAAAGRGSPDWYPAARRDFDRFAENLLEREAEEYSLFMKGL